MSPENPSRPEPFNPGRYLRYYKDVYFTEACKYLVDFRSFLFREEEDTLDLLIRQFSHAGSTWSNNDLESSGVWALRWELLWMACHDFPQQHDFYNVFRNLRHPPQQEVSTLQAVPGNVWAKPPFKFSNPFLDSIDPSDFRELSENEVSHLKAAQSIESSPTWPHFLNDLPKEQSDQQDDFDPDTFVDMYLTRLILLGDPATVFPTMDFVVARFHHVPFQEIAPDEYWEMFFTDFFSVLLLGYVRLRDGSEPLAMYAELIRTQLLKFQENIKTSDYYKNEHALDLDNVRIDALISLPWDHPPSNVSSEGNRSQHSGYAKAQLVTRADELVKATETAGGMTA